jgi:hypothetical protein
MNAKQQYTQMKNVKEIMIDLVRELSKDSPNFDPFYDRSWKIFRDMLSTIDHRVHQFGDEAYPLSDKQWELVKKIVSDKFVEINSEYARIGKPRH